MGDEVNGDSGSQTRRPRPVARRPGDTDPLAHPLRTEPDDPPPAREQLPLPRRRGQAHLEPQLRTPGSPGGGTPFTAFAADESDGERADENRDAPTAAAFSDGTRRARDHADPPPEQPR